MEEERDALTSAVVDSGSDFTETRYLLYGLDLEEQQYVSAGLFLVLGPDTPKA